jgi:hypothetical protein
VLQVVSAQPLGNDLAVQMQTQGGPVRRRAVCETLVGVEPKAFPKGRDNTGDLLLNADMLSGASCPGSSSSATCKQEGAPLWGKGA